jgi:hypothetical protein
MTIGWFLDALQENAIGACTVRIQTPPGVETPRAGGSCSAGFFLHSFPFQATINRPVRYAGSGSRLPLKREGVRYANRCSVSESSL